MHVHFGLDLLQAEWPESVVCIGTFDGVHLGHQAVIGAAVAKAREKGQPSVLVTFDRHPAAIVAPERCPPTIASLQSNLMHFEQLGISLAAVLTFDRSLSETHADQFFQDTLLHKLRAGSVVVGYDFAFGKDREGSPEWLKERIETEIVPPFQLDGVRVSSTSVRKCIEAGGVETAAKLLGRPFEIPGIVVGGQRLGRELGYPTLNLARSFYQVTPADGVYAGHCDTVRGTFPAAISIGVRPTIDAQRTIEAYLLDYPGDEIYGTAVRLHIARRLRDQMKFDNLEDLKEQMATDVRLVSHVN
jgi:riboflavin kinase/FMN adenylyltransferase